MQNTGVDGSIATQAEQIEDLKQRLARMEKARLMKTLGFVLVVLVFAAQSIPFASAVGGPPFFRAQEFDLVDSHGRIVAILGTKGQRVNGSTMKSTIASHGLMKSGIIASGPSTSSITPSGPRLTFYDVTGNLIASVGENTTATGAGLDVFDGNTFFPGPTGQAHLRGTFGFSSTGIGGGTLDQNGTIRAVFGQSPLGPVADTAAVSVYAPSGIEQTALAEIGGLSFRGFFLSDQNAARVFLNEDLSNSTVGLAVNDITGLRRIFQGIDTTGLFDSDQLHQVPASILYDDAGRVKIGFTVDPNNEATTGGEYFFFTDPTGQDLGQFGVHPGEGGYLQLADPGNVVTFHAP